MSTKRLRAWRRCSPVSANVNDGIDGSARIPVALPRKRPRARDPSSVVNVTRNETFATLGRVA
jgi:hypothetical protein